MRKYFNNLYVGDFDKLKFTLSKNIKEEKKMFIVTANPETFMLAKQNKDFDKILTDKKNTIVVDGIGIIKACKKLKIKNISKIPGVDISKHLLELANLNHSKVFLLGATEEINDLLNKKIKEDYPNITIVASYNGYLKDLDKKIKEVLTLKPDIIMVALGIPKQELLINSIYSKAKKGIFIGVGGSFDVISGGKKRAPKIFLKTNTEWLYRILKEPKRIKRFYNYNIKFFKNIK